MKKEDKVLFLTIISIIFGVILGFILFKSNLFFKNISHSITVNQPQTVYLLFFHILFGIIVFGFIGFIIGNVAFDIENFKKFFDKLKDSHLKLMFFLEKQKWLPVLFVFVILYLFWGTRMDLSLLFRDTIVTGGDTASWHQIAHHLKSVLIPHGRLFGWSNGNFFGYNELQHYFIPPFLLAVILSLFFPLTIALKLSSVAGLFLTPIFFYISLKKITKNIWVSLAGSLLSLIFIFNESYTMYGGNFLSTLAGEFSYSFALAFFVLFIGLCYDVFTKNKNPIFAGLILGFIGLSHFFVFMPAFFVPFFFILFKKPFFLKKDKNTGGLAGDFWKLLAIYSVGLLLMAFWLIPMILKRGFTTPTSMIWQFYSFKEFFLSVFAPFTLVGILLNILTFTFNSKKMKTFALFIFYMYGVTFFLYFISPALGSPDIRFVPPMLIISVFSIALAIHTLFYKFNRKTFFPIEIYTLIFVLAVSFIFVIVGARNVAGWFSWNNTGYEAKKSYPDLEKIILKSGGTINDGRFIWEKLRPADNTDFGSERAFENLYFFTGRPSAEGVLYQSSFMARSVTYMQSEYSERPVDPEANRIYSKINPDVWPYRFYQINAKEIILFSDKLKSLFKSHKYFTHSYDTRKFSIYSFNDFNKSYIDIVDLENIATVSSPYSFTKNFYRYFRDYELIDHPFVPEKYADKTFLKCKHFSDYDLYRAHYDKPLPPFSDWLENKKYKNSISDENITDFSIKFKTLYPGKPHIIKITYSKNFKSKNGEKIYPISPGFMMIIPKTKEVSIYFGWTLGEIIGLILTILIIPLIILGILFRKKIAAIKLPFPKIIYVLSLVIFTVVGISLFIRASFVSHTFDRNYYTAYKYFNQKKYKKAYDLVRPYATEEILNKYDNMLALNYIIMREKLLVKLGKQNKFTAIHNLENLMYRYRHSRINNHIRSIINEIKNY